MTNNNTQSFVPPPAPQTTEELARFVVDAIRSNYRTASAMRTHYASIFNKSIGAAVFERATQFARRQGWIRFQANRWSLDKPPGSAEGIRVTVVLEMSVEDLAHYDATTIEEAGDYLQTQLDEQHMGVDEVLAFANRVASVQAEGRHDLLPFADPPELDKPNATGTDGNDREQPEPDNAQKPSAEAGHLRIVREPTSDGGSE